jgi:hypothetical protein
MPADLEQMPASEASQPPAGASPTSPAAPHPLPRRWHSEHAWVYLVVTVVVLLALFLTFVEYIHQL